MNSAAVDVDDVSSWPLQLREHTDTWLRRLQETPPAPNEPEIGWDADEPLLALLGADRSGPTTALASWITKLRTSGIADYAR